MAVNRDEEFKYSFCDLATQYYVVGRLAARAGQVPVHGNLLHHAVEMYLKGALIGTLSLAQMKQRPYSHDIRALWDAFKAKANDPALASFDATIQALHEFESIRYPDEIVAKGLATGVSWAPGEIPLGGTNIKMPPLYVVIIHEVDNLVIEILERASVNPKAISILISSSTAREALEYHNPRAAKWRRD